MGFKEEMLSLSKQVQELKQLSLNEESTKHSLILPFIKTLGYDVFNPLEVRPEYTADFGKKKTDKVDYAIIKNENPIIFIEAKGINENLQNHDAQLAKYFNSTPNVKLAIITNGVKYKFFTDLQLNNIMDTEPFFEVDMLKLNDYSISILQRFSKESFDVTQVAEMATELNNISNINSTLRDLFENPTDDFIRFLIKDICKDRLTANVIERFRPIVKKSIKDAVLAFISQGIFANEFEEKVSNQLSEKTDNSEKQDKPENDVVEKKVKQEFTATADELETFEIIKKTLIAYGKNIEGLNYKVTSNYLTIYIKNPGNWFLRAYLNGSIKTLTTRLPIDNTIKLCPELIVEESTNGNEASRIIIEKHIDVKGLKSMIVTCFEYNQI